MPLNLAAFSWSDGLSQGLSDFTTIFNTVMGNPLLGGVVIVGVGASVVALIWGVLRR